VELLKKLYIDEKKSTWEIAKKFGETQKLIISWLLRAGIKTRSYAEASAITKNGFKPNEKHFNWKGDKVGYNSLHIWVRKNKPRVKNCERCGKEKNLELSNNGIYGRDFKNWEWLCRSCHLKKDYNSGQRKKI
jgi:hypothetical protein